MGKPDRDALVEQAIADCPGCGSDRFSKSCERCESAVDEALDESLALLAEEKTEYSVADLAPCKFCYSTDLWFAEPEHSTEGYRIECSSCNARGPAVLYSEKWRKEVAQKWGLVSAADEQVNQTAKPEQDRDTKLLTYHSAISFGKYAGKTGQWILENDPGYICWLHSCVVQIRVESALLLAAQNASTPKRSKSAHHTELVSPRVERLWESMANYRTARSVDYARLENRILTTFLDVNTLRALQPISELSAQPSENAGQTP